MKTTPRGPPKGVCPLQWTPAAHLDIEGRRVDACCRTRHLPSSDHGNLGGPTVSVNARRERNTPALWRQRRRRAILPVAASLHSTEHWCAVALLSRLRHARRHRFRDQQHGRRLPRGRPPPILDPAVRRTSRRTIRLHGPRRGRSGAGGAAETGGHRRPASRSFGGVRWVRGRPGAGDHGHWSWRPGAGTRG